jgi:hypothetical protein
MLFAPYQNKFLKIIGILWRYGIFAKLYDNYIDGELYNFMKINDITELGSDSPKETVEELLDFIKKRDSLYIDQN